LEFYLFIFVFAVLKPNGMSFVDAAGCIGDSVKAYTALHYLGRLSSGDTGNDAVSCCEKSAPRTSSVSVTYMLYP
jgi:hypothetical protein